MAKYMKLADVLAQNITRLMAKMPDLDTIEKVSLRSGVGRGTVDRVKKAEVSTKIDTLELLASAFGVSPLRLLSSDDRNDEGAPAGYIRLPLLAAPHGMGRDLAEIQFPEITQYIDVLETWARMQLGTTNPAGIQIVPAVGDSMKGTIEDGSIVFVDTNVREYEGDGLYAIVWGGRVQIKRLQAKHKEQKLFIKSDNGKYEIDEADETLIISGRVRAWWNLSRP